MPLNVGTPMGSDAYTTVSTENAYANAYGGSTVASGNASGGKTSFRYPLKRLDETSDYLEIKVFDYVGGGFQIGPPIQAPTVQQRLKANRSDVKYYIILPVPQNVNDNNQVSWGEDNINPIETAMLGLGEATIKQGPAAAFDAAVKNLQQLKNITDAQKSALTSYLNARSVSLLGTNVNAQSFVSRTTGQILNSNLELLFNGVNLRTFPFVFDLAPRSRQEAEEIKQMIRVFKQTMSAKNNSNGSGDNTSAGLFISAPSIYQLTYKTGPAKHPFLNTFKPCALTDISVNYTASGTYATYDDGSPVHLQMSLTFKELNPVYSEDYDQEDAQIGVGY